MSSGSIGAIDLITFTFSSRIAIGIEDVRWLHRDECEELQSRLVLHHVTHHACVVVVGGAIARRPRLRQP